MYLENSNCGAQMQRIIIEQLTEAYKSQRQVRAEVDTNLFIIDFISESDFENKYRQTKKKKDEI